eukprot:TRINITY_DN59693_c0_g1_i2.p1 TRINITY_DN59693_c0_g1~~TRINITY_DN59693_c0_g1_i2.p1  ORF type:complete len:187 (+),score=39.13 TRINITY_DN59693_c0_g1_i2:243-803(+)
MLALHEADPVTWSLPNICSRYGIKMERVKAIMELQIEERDAMKAGQLEGKESPMDVLWEVVDVPVKPPTSDARGSTHNKTHQVVGTRSNRYQAVPEGVTREEVMEVLYGVQEMAPKVAEHVPETKQVDEIVRRNVTAHPGGPQSRFKFVFRDATDELPFLIRGNDGTAELQEVVIPPPKVYRRKRA